MLYMTTDRLLAYLGVSTILGTLLRDWTMLLLDGRWLAMIAPLVITAGLLVALTRMSRRDRRRGREVHDGGEQRTGMGPGDPGAAP